MESNEEQAWETLTSGNYGAQVHILSIYISLSLHTSYLSVWEQFI